MMTHLRRAPIAIRKEIIICGTTILPSKITAVPSPSTDPTTAPAPVTTLSKAPLPPSMPATPHVNRPTTLVPPKPPDNLGWGPDGRSHHLRKKGVYHCSIGNKNVSLGVRRAHISMKKVKYQQCLAKHGHKGDCMYLSMEDNEIPSTNQLVACPLSRFIDFAADDYGYDRTCKEVIVNWVHLFFLKARSEASNTATQFCGYCSG